MPLLAPNLLPRFATAVCLLALASSGCAVREPENQPAAGADEAAVVVRAEPAERRPLAELVLGIGRTEPLPDHWATLTPAVAGQIAEVRFVLGQTVRAGERVIALDAAIAQADLAGKQANRQTLQAALDLLTAEPRAEDRKGLEISVQQAKESVARAQAALDRLKPLQARKELSGAQLYEAEQLLLQSKLQQDAAEAQLNLLLAGPRPEAVAEARSRLAAGDEAVRLSEAQLALHDVASPIDGVVDSLTCHAGQAIAAGTAIGEVVDTRQLNIVVWLPPSAAGRVRPDQQALLSNRPETSTFVEQSGQAPSESVLGVVTSIGQIADAQTGNVPVRILCDNSHFRFAVGETVSLSIVVHRHDEELVVPTTAIVDLGDGPTVVVVRDGKIALLHPTHIATHGHWTIVAGTDLAPGEQVVVDGGFNLPENTLVRVETAGHDELQKSAEAGSEAVQ